VNAFWGNTSIKREDHITPVPFSSLTVVRAIHQLLEHDWSGGAVVCTVSPVRQLEERPVKENWKATDRRGRLLEKARVHSIWGKPSELGGVDAEPLKTHLPRHLLGVEGWRTLEPFVPVRVEDMTRSEASSLMDYFCERRWLQAAVSGTDEGKKELFFRSGGNPGKLVELCGQY